MHRKCHIRRLRPLGLLVNATGPGGGKSEESEMDYMYAAEDVNQERFRDAYIRSLA